MRIRRRLVTALTTVALTLGVVAPSITSATPATAQSKSQVLSSWTQTSSASYSAWVDARNNRSQWSSYGFDWSTDLCSSSPDNPLGFPFEMSCARHDFGYRNYKDMGSFSANKSRLDSAFYEDLKRVCNRYSGASGAACDALAWTYYQAVRNFG